MMQHVGSQEKGKQVQWVQRKQTKNLKSRQALKNETEMQAGYKSRLKHLGKEASQFRG